MGKRIEDLKETAPCGMLIHYTVNEEDMITYNDINGRGVHCDKCDGCTWKGICKPEEPKKAMSHKTYIEIYNLIDDAMQEAGEKVEEACNKLAKSDADPKCVLACNMVEQIKKYQKRGIHTPARSVHHVQWVRKHPRLAMSRTYTYNGKEYVNLIPLCEACHNEQHPDKRVKTEFKKEHFVNEERW